MANENKKKAFLIVSSNQERQNLISQFIINHYDKPVIYTATNGNLGLLKLQNAMVDIIISDVVSSTPDSVRMVDQVLLENQNPRMAVIVIGYPPDDEDRYVEELVMGKLHFVESLDELEFVHTLVKALNFTSHTEPAAFYLRYLAKDDVLIKEGEKAEFVYILRSGALHAFNIVENKKIILGRVEIGEFVGEMAYINNEPRSAYIEALTDSQLIEIPIDMVDKILFKRPTWSKALMQTLSKRLKFANQRTLKK
ncbi:MAG: cyclic nucleotide-binding domain-containing protein [Bacteriovorax sp.]|jgi:hypothetical protein